MNADTSKSNGQYAYVVATGDVYRYLSSVWTAENPVTQYYTAKVIPRSLAAKITAKSGNVLTLDHTATVSTANANVYFDNYPLFLAHGADPADTEIVWPSGTFALSDVCVALDKDNWYIHGAGKTLTELFFPKGIAGVALIKCAGFGSNNRVSDLCVRGNAGDEGFMMAWLNGSQLDARYQFGIQFEQIATGSITDTKSIDVFQGGVEVAFSGDISVYRHDAYLTVGLKCYIAWLIQGIDSNNGTFVDCTVTSNDLTQGIEWFRSTDVSIINYGGTNAVMSLNTVDRWTITSPTVTIESNSQRDEASFSNSNAILVVSDIIGGGSVANGGTLTNPTFVQQGYINSDNDSLRGIIIDTLCPNVTVSGGSYTAPDYASPSTLNGPQGLVSDGTNTNVSCFTCYGQIKSGTPSVSLSNIGVDKGSISYCRAGSIYGTPGTVTLTGNGLTSDPQNPFCTGIASAPRFNRNRGKQTHIYSPGAWTYGR
jgi:hypothetical protein